MDSRELHPGLPGHRIEEEIETKVLVLFESAYGNTRRIAEAIGAGFAESDDVRVEPVANVDPTSLRADLHPRGRRTDPRPRSGLPDQLACRG